jgi:catechol 1,2-dioxygenase
MSPLPVAVIVGVVLARTPRRTAMTTLERDPTTETDTTERLAAIVDDVVGALREVITSHRVTWHEYRAATEWLTTAGHQAFEIPLMMDVFLSTTVDDLQASGEGTESNVEGPFYVPDAPMLSQPYVLPRRENEPGETLLFSGTVSLPDGSPLDGAVVDVWQDNGEGEYSHFHPGVPEHNLRGRLLTDADGSFEFETVMPVPYEIPTGGATGQLLRALDRPPVRPAHIHFKLSHPSARALTTQIYFDGDHWLDHDVVVGAVKASLVARVERTSQTETVEPATCRYDFVLSPAD